MITGAAFRAKVTKLLTDVQATERVVQFREVTRTGGNALLGIGGTVTNTDTAIVPQPAVSQVTAEEIAGGSGLIQPGDWKFIFDSQVPEATLRNRLILFGDEVLQIVRIKPYPFQGAPVAWSVIARTVTTRT